ncbi:MAG: TlpA family protein disulfide reductase [Nitrospirae bacterium]|nr:TlpA family protein disulfide reductase [Nitrospirota bacterium]
MKPKFLNLIVAAGLLLALASCQKASQTDAPATPALARVATVGQPAPDFTLRDLQGGVHRLSALKGNVVFVNFWATWCPPCRSEMPDMQTLNNEMAAAGKPFQMLAILYNTEPQLGANFVTRYGYKFPVLLDPANEASQAYGITGVPETYIVDKNGILREKFLGPLPWNSPEAKAMLNKYM